MLAMKKSGGTTPVLRDLLKISVEAGATSSAASFLAGTSPESAALCSPRSFNSFNAPSRVIFIVGIDWNNVRENRFELLVKNLSFLYIF